MSNNIIIPRSSHTILNNVFNIEKSEKLFILPGIEGNCDVFKDLAGLLGKTNILVYGINFSVDVPTESIHSIAGHFFEVIKQIMTNLNETQLYLSAYSSGGTIIFELMKIILNELNEKKLNVKKIFLFDTSHDFQSLNSHKSMMLFNLPLSNGIFAYPPVYKVFITVITLGQFSAAHHKKAVYEYIKDTQSFDEALDKAFEYLKINLVYNCEYLEETEEIKRNIKLNIIKLDAGLRHKLTLKEKIKQRVILLQPHRSMYPWSNFNEEYFKKENSIKFNIETYNLEEICEDYVIHRFKKGNHWSFINENIAIISDLINKEIFKSDLSSKL